MKPTKVRPVQDAALYAQRKAKYDAELIVYQKAMAEYEAGQRVRAFFLMTICSLVLVVCSSILSAYHLIKLEVLEQRCRSSWHL